MSSHLLIMMKITNQLLGSALIFYSLLLLCLVTTTTKSTTTTCLINAFKTPSTSLGAYLRQYGKSQTTLQRHLYQKQNNVFDENYLIQRGTHQLLQMAHILSSTTKSTASISRPRNSTPRKNDSMLIHIDEQVGSGSYGTVHLCHYVLTDNNNNNSNNNNFDVDNTDQQQNHSSEGITTMIAKRAWTESDLIKQAEQASKNNNNNKSFSSLSSSKAKVLSTFQQQRLEQYQLNENKPRKKAFSYSTNQSSKERAKQCAHYFNVERHCFEKLQKKRHEQINKNHDIISNHNANKKKTSLSSSSSIPTAIASDQIPNYIGMLQDDVDGHEWLVFSLIQRKSYPCKDVKHDNHGDLSDGTSTNTGMTSPTGKKIDLSNVAINLADAIHTDWKKQHDVGNQSKRNFMMKKPEFNTDGLDSNKEIMEIEQSPLPVPHHHLSIVSRELGLPQNTTFQDTLDVVFTSLLTVVSYVHDANVVHRDLKPSNLLCDPSTSSLVLIDFGSAADMDPAYSTSSPGLGSWGIGRSKSRIGLDGTSMAVSPIYAAPESLVKWDRAPLTFDMFSAALIFCQLLFNLLDDRTDSAFRQQLEDAEYDLDNWLARGLSSTVRPAGLENAISYLGERPGLWKLLKDMLVANPELRETSQHATKRLNQILAITKSGEVHLEGDGSYFDSVLLAEVCELPAEEVTDVDPETAEEAMLKTLRPLHFVATFDRNKPLGLVLSEADVESKFADNTREKMNWDAATFGASAGEVFVQKISTMGQADKKGIFEIGDRLQSVGDLPVAGGGFEKVLTMLSRQPTAAKTVRLQFDRPSVVRKPFTKKSAPHHARVVDQGAWSSKGKRKVQEDTFILHEIADKQDGGILLAGVFDGHGGTSASQIAAGALPDAFAFEFSSRRVTSFTSVEIAQAIKSAWEKTCTIYRSGCDEEGGTCVAEYDTVTGQIMAGTGSKNLVAGTTAVAAILSANQEGGNDVTILNCGDSRALLVGTPLDEELSSGRSGEIQFTVHFCTRDHVPSDKMEANRLKNGRDAGYNFSLPECSLSRWWLTVGDYQYAVSRSLEGTFASSFGIVSDPDVSTISLSDMLSERKNAVLIMASDGLFEVMDNEEIGREVLIMREAGLSAGDAAKAICDLSLQKGTSDNVCVIVVYLD